MVATVSNAVRPQGNAEIYEHLYHQLGIIGRYRIPAHALYPQPDVCRYGVAAREYLRQILQPFGQRLYRPRHAAHKENDGRQEDKEQQRVDAAREYEAHGYSHEYDRQKERYQYDEPVHEPALVGKVEHAEDDEQRQDGVEQEE